jgi:hypothetical protein
MPRWRNQHDANHMEVFNALKVAGCEPVHGRDSDIYARHSLGYGMLIEVKTPKGKLRPLQEKLRDLFQDRYVVARSPEDALRACGRLL